MLHLCTVLLPTHIQHATLRVLKDHLFAEVAASSSLLYLDASLNMISSSLPAAWTNLALLFLKLNGNILTGQLIGSLASAAFTMHRLLP